MSTITNGEKLVCMTGLEAIRYTLENLDREFNFKGRDMEYYDDVLMTAKEIILQGVNK